MILILKNDILPFIYQKEKNDDDSNDNYSFDLITRRNIKFFNNIMINKNYIITSFKIYSLLPFFQLSFPSFP